MSWMCQQYRGFNDYECAPASAAPLRRDRRSAIGPAKLLVWRLDDAQLLSELLRADGNRVTPLARTDAARVSSVLIQRFPDPAPMIPRPQFLQPRDSQYAGGRIIIVALVPHPSVEGVYRNLWMTKHTHKKLSME